MNARDQIAAAAETTATARPGFKPRAGMILGSGLDRLADAITDETVIAYGGLAGFPAPSVEGHQSELILGLLGGVEVACLRGRAHYYEGHGAGVMRVAVHTLAAMGCEILLVTNAAGSLVPNCGPGSLMLIADHINFAGANPLISVEGGDGGDGDSGDAGNARFVNMTDAYDPELRVAMRQAAADLDIEMQEGVYIWFTGPSFETPAEIRAARTLGADAVGMSTVPEVILARQAGLRVVAVSNITNLAAGIGDEGEEISHENTLRMAAEGGAKLEKIIIRFLEEL